MRTTSKSTIQYAPAPVPLDPTQLSGYLQNEFQNVHAAIQLLALGHLDATTVAPPHPRDGDIRLADGAPNWNPGSGRGIYRFNGPTLTWAFLG